MAKKDVGGYPIPNVIDPEETMSVTLCVPKNRDHLATFFGALYELTIWTSWQRDAEHSAVQVADVWSRYWLSWDRTLRDTECEDGMAKCCVEPIKETRLNPVTGRPEVRYDGGAWQPDPSDPQYAVLLQPPIVGEGLPNTKCDAASNALQHFEDIVNGTSSNIATASSLFTFVVAIVTVLLEVFIIIVSGGAGSPLALTIAGMIWGAAQAVFSAGQAAFDDYWTTDALDKVLCALYCNIGENGQFTEDQYQAFLTDVRFELPSSPARDLVLTSITAGGAAGLSNMASYGGSADSDCSECECDDCGANEPVVTNGVLVDYDPETCIFHYQSAPLSGTNLLALYWETDDNCVIVTEHEGSGGTPINYTWLNCGSPTYNSGPVYGGDSVWYWDKTSAAPFDMYLSFSRP